VPPHATVGVFGETATVTGGGAVTVIVTIGEVFAGVATDVAVRFAVPAATAVAVVPFTDTTPILLLAIVAALSVLPSL